MKSEGCESLTLTVPGTYDRRCARNPKEPVLPCVQQVCSVLGSGYFPVSFRRLCKRLSDDLLEDTVRAETHDVG